VEAYSVGFERHLAAQSIQGLHMQCGTHCCTAYLQM
jgi:hypothetical protein